MTPGRLVSAFISALEIGDLEGALASVADDVEYDNGPLGVVHGPAGIREVLTPFLTRYDELSWVVHHQAETGDLRAGTVLHERTDRFRRGLRWVEIPVAGVFVVRDGRIVRWRDYFDLTSANEAVRVR
jgi:limonene-1,2-epoxide hydrolase